MKKTLLLIAVLSSLASVADAAIYRRPGGQWPRRPPVAAPEINPASAGSALMLLLGGLTVLRSRVGKR
jgi:hypothetical protein